MGREHSGKNIRTNVSKWLLENKNKSVNLYSFKSPYIAKLIKVGGLECVEDVGMNCTRTVENYCKAHYDEEKEMENEG
jgi:hypothetical protein